jgi:hypothetical protein
MYRHISIYLEHSLDRGKSDSAQYAENEALPGRYGVFDEGE